MSKGPMLNPPRLARAEIEAVLKRAIPRANEMSKRLKTTFELSAEKANLRLGRIS